MTYLFKCSLCGYLIETPVYDPAPACASDDHPDLEVLMRRDYRAEAVGLGNVSELRRNRESGLDRETAARLFLPEAKDFRGPGDPTGQHGLREWADQHVPRGDNKRPQYPPDLERRSF